jgi:GNAT superfamily N-acetyltransferase
VDYRKNMSLIGLSQKGGSREIMAIGSYAEEEDDRAEVAFVVREDYQKMGISSYLLKELEKIAKGNDYKGFSATVLRENSAMFRVFKKRYPNAVVSMSGGDLAIKMDFADATESQKKEDVCAC